QPTKMFVIKRTLPYLLRQTPDTSGASPMHLPKSNPKSPPCSIDGDGMFACNIDNCYTGSSVRLQLCWHRPDSDGYSGSLPASLASNQLVYHNTVFQRHVR